MDLDLLAKFLTLMININDPVGIEMSPALRQCIEGYKHNSRESIAQGLHHAFKIYAKENEAEHSAISLGLILGVLTAHMTTSFDGKKYLQTLVDRTLQEKIRHKNSLHENNTNNTVMNSVNEWLAKNKGDYNI